MSSGERWHVVPVVTELSMIHDENGLTVAHSVNSCDAHLMAAAPQMLEALELVLAHEGALTGADWALIRAAVDAARVATVDAS